MPYQQAEHEVAQALRNGQKIRFWNLPATDPESLRAIWRELLRYPALLVGADELQSLQQTIQQHARHAQN